MMRATLKNDVFSAIAEPRRREIIGMLSSGQPHAVGEIVAALRISQPSVSKHLGVLHEAGILSRRKDGTSTLYAIADESVLALCEQVCGGLQRQFSDLAELVGGALR